MHNWLVIFAKEPKIGAVKSRLARGIGAVEAARFYRNETTRLIRRVGNDPRWQTILAVTPDTVAGQSGNWWPVSVPRIPQGAGDLGQRMGRVFERLPPGPVVIVGSDIPQVTRRHIAQGFCALGRNDVVFGPASDGGYYLVGQRRRPRTLSLFDNVRWSTGHTLDDTLKNLPSDKTVGFLETLSDVDRVEDLQACKSIPRQRY